MHGQILSTGARVWAHFDENEYYLGVISEIKDTMIRVDFDDGYVMFYKNGHLGQVLLDRKAVPSELGIGVEVIVKENKKNVMRKGVICDMSRGLFRVKLEDESQKYIRKRASSLVVVENYEIKESEPTGEEIHVIESSAEETVLVESSAEESDAMERSAEETVLVETEESDAMERSAEETELMKSSFEAPVFLLDIPPNSPEQRGLPNPISPEVLWEEHDLIALQSMVDNCASRVFNSPCPASLQQQQQQLSRQPAVAELSVGALFDPLRKPTPASHTPVQINVVICACQTTNSSGLCNGNTGHHSQYCQTSTPGSTGRHTILFPAMSKIYAPYEPITPDAYGYSSPDTN